MTEQNLAIPASLPREVLACSAVAAGARFVPVPLLDDFLKDRANRLALSRTLRAGNREVDVRDLSPLYSNGGIGRFLLGLPWKVLLFPVRKIVRLLGAVRGVPTDALETYLLARTVQRHSAAGGFAHQDRAQLKQEAKQVRRAFDKAFSGTNWRVLTATFAQLRKGDGSADRTAEVEQALSRRDVQSELFAFDRRFDDAWGH